MSEADYFVQAADEPLTEILFVMFCPLCEQRVPVRWDADRQRIEHHWHGGTICRFSGREVRDRVRARQGI